MTKLAIIGAGLAGLTLANQLSDIFDISIFEKYHHVGGRMAQRTSPPFEFDHGAQFFTIKNPEFLTLINQLIENGVVDRWDARFVEIDSTQIKKSRKWDDEFPHFVGKPNMSSVCIYLAEKLIERGVKIYVNTQVSVINPLHNEWQLKDKHDGDLGGFDWVVTAIPSAQTHQLMPDSFLYKKTIESIQMDPCFALLLGFETQFDLAWDAAHITNSNLSWISVNSSKPNRNNHKSMVVMSRNDWATQHFHADQQWVIDNLMHSFRDIVGKQFLNPVLVELKRWHFANVQKNVSSKLLLDTEQNLAACGDWFISGRIESAFASAMMLAKEMRNYI